MEAVNGKQLKSLQIREMYEVEKKASGERKKDTKHVVTIY